MRSYSWVITQLSARAATKAHIEQLRAIALSPPAPPFAIVLSDSGQTHQLYRGVVNYVRDPVVVSLEAERIEYRLGALRSLIDLASRIAAVCGKPALAPPVGIRQAILIMEHYPDGEGESILENWQRQAGTGVGRLAAWLCPGKDHCDRYWAARSGHRGVPAPARAARRSARTAGRRGRS